MYFLSLLAVHELHGRRVSRAKFLLALGFPKGPFSEFHLESEKTLQACFGDQVLRLGGSFGRIHGKWDTTGTTEAFTGMLV